MCWVFVSEYATITSINKINQDIFVKEKSLLNSVQNLLSFIMLSKNTKINLLNTKRRLLYLKTQFIPRSKHFPPRL